MESIRQRFENLDMKNRGYNYLPNYKPPKMPSHKQESRDRHLCNGSRCSASKERAASRSYEDLKARRPSRSRSQGGAGGSRQLRTMAELK